MAHLKRYVMPEAWPLPRKEKVFVTSPVPGPHPKHACMPLQIVIRDVLKFAKTGKEARKIIKSGKVFVDKKPRKEERFPVGFMDIVEIPEIEKHYRVEIGKKGIILKEIGKEESDKKLCRIQGKKAIRGGKIQLNLHDGRNILIETEEAKKYNVGDSVLISLPDQKILKEYKAEKGAPAIIFSGRNKGARGTIKEIIKRKTMQTKNMVVIKTEDKKEIQTLKDHIIVGEI